MGSGKSGGSQVIGYKYYMGLHLVFCHGPADFVGPIYAGERQFHAGRASSGSISVNAPKLFGGEKKEGGIVGTVDVMMGESTQGQNAYLASVLGADNVPGYRGVVSLVANKVYICAMSPYPKAWAAQIKRIPGQDWYAAKADINSGSANGAHILREAILDPNWGMGYPFTAIDNDSFVAAADTLYDEGLGLSLLLSGQGSVEDFIQQIQKHINSVIYTDRSTGKFVLKLIRDDYVIGDLPVFSDGTNIVDLASFQRPLYSEMVNEVVVVYRPRGAFSDAAATFQDLASIQAQGGVVSQTLQYPGIDSAANAGVVGLRELKQHATPLATARIIANRDAWDLNPGDPFVFNWAPKGISQMVMRAMSINYGGLTKGQIEINAVEDIFGVPDAVYLTPPDSQWSDPVGDPVAVPESRIEEVPYWDLATQLSAADLDYIEADDCFVNHIARKPTVASSGYGMWTKPSGAADYTRQTTGVYAPTALLLQDLDKLTETGVSASLVGLTADDIVIGQYAYLDDEIIRIDAWDGGANTIDVGRGCLDSVPAEHANGARIWFAELNGGVDGNAYLPAETVETKATPITGRGELEVTAASAESITLDNRQDLPYPPGRFAFNTVLYPEAFVDGLALTWAHRDRLLQTARPINDHTDTSIGPEAGTTYDVAFYGENDLVTTPLRTATGISGTSRTWTEEEADSGLWIYSPVDTHSFLLPLDTNHRVEGPDQTVEWASNLTNVTFDGDWATFAGNGYMDVEDIDIGESFSIVFGLKGGTYTPASQERTVANKTSAAGANIFSLALYSTYFRVRIGTVVLSPGSWTTTYGTDRDHYFLVTVQKDLPTPGYTTITAYIDGHLIGSTNYNTVVGAMAGKPWAVGARWTGVSTRGDYLSSSIHRLAFFKSVLSATDVWPLQRLNATLRATAGSQRDGKNSRQRCDHLAERAGWGYNYGNYFGGI